MILVVNGDSHTAGAEAVNQHSFAYDDGNYYHMGRQPHPDNLRVSWGIKLSKMLAATPHVLAESASSNRRILRTTRQFLNQKWDGNDDILVVIQWSTWEREEWEIDGEMFQVNASGIDHVPDSHKKKYKQFVANVDWQECTRRWHKEIWKFHNELTKKNIPHIFFNGNTDFGSIRDQKDWGTSYIGPYDKTQTYHNQLQALGHNTVSKDSYHYDEQAHSEWSKFMIRYILDNKIIS